MQSFGEYALSLTPDERQQRYGVLAASALKNYALGRTHPAFIQHNAGIVFRVAVPGSDQHYLLKLHARLGEGENSSEEVLEAGMRWLADAANAKDLIVQTPVKTTSGRFVGRVVAQTGQVIYCTLQQWLPGKPPQGHFTADQVRRIGMLTARLHTLSQQHPVSNDVPATRHDAGALEQNVMLLRTALDEQVLSPDDFAIIVRAQRQIVMLMDDLGTGSGVWGVVHGDLHHDNLIFDGDVVSPIDFTGLRLAHFAYDLGVTLYHIFYQPPSIRRALLAGYRAVRELSETYIPHVEASVAYAAIDNIAWNSTLPEQVHSDLFKHNLRQLVVELCTPVAEGRRFVFT